MRTLDQTLFVVCWESSQSVTEVSIALAKAGHPEMDCQKVLRVAWTMRKLGCNLKPLPRPVFPRQDAELSGESLAEYAEQLVKVCVERNGRVA